MLICGVIDNDLLADPETVPCWRGEREAGDDFVGSLIGVFTGDFRGDRHLKTERDRALSGDLNPA